MVRAARELAELGGPLGNHGLGRDDEEDVRFLALNERVEDGQERDGLAGSLFIEDAAAPAAGDGERRDVKCLVVIEDRDERAVRKAGASRFGPLV